MEIAVAVFIDEVVVVVGVAGLTVVQVVAGDTSVLTVLASHILILKSSSLANALRT